MTLLKRVLAAVRSARPAATGQAVVTLETRIGNQDEYEKATFTGTASQVRAAHAEFYAGLRRSK